MTEANARLLRRQLRRRGTEPGYVDVMIRVHGEAAVARALDVMQRPRGRQWEEPPQPKDWKSRPLQYWRRIHDGGVKSTRRRQLHVGEGSR